MNKNFDTKKAERYFKERRIPYQLIDLARYGFSPREFETVRAAVGLKAMINTKARDYDSSYIAYLADESGVVDKLFENPSLYNAPFVRNGRAVTVGYCPDIWKTWE